MHEKSRLGIFVRSADAHKSRRSSQMIGMPRPVCFAPLLCSVRAYIQHNMSQRITVEDLAGIANLKAFQLIRVFHREYATTPYAFVLRIRVERAKELLKLGVRIADAAVDTGFSDQSHLTRHFKRLEGTTPTFYRTTNCV